LDWKRVLILYFILFYSILDDGDVVVDYGAVGIPMVFPSTACPLAPYLPSGAVAGDTGAGSFLVGLWSNNNDNKSNDNDNDGIHSED
jgi:hypothetical protein